jgi:hypothetical protein
VVDWLAARLAGVSSYRCRRARFPCRAANRYGHDQASGGFVRFNRHGHCPCRWDYPFANDSTSCFYFDFRDSTGLNALGHNDMPAPALDAPSIVSVRIESIQRSRLLVQNLLRWGTCSAPGLRVRAVWAEPVLLTPSKLQLVKR